MMNSFSCPSPRFPSLLLVSLLALFFSAAGRADTVVLKNGDRITGALKGLNDGKLSFETSYAGTIEIDWKQVQQLVTTGKVEMEAAAGALYRGTLTGAASGMQIVTGDEVLPVKRSEVVRIRPYHGGQTPGFWDILDGSVDAGFSLTRGNSQLTQSSVGIDGSYRREKYKLSGTATSLFSRQDDAPPTSRQTAQGRYDRFLGKRKFGFALAALERSDRQRLNLRSRAGGGFGYKLKDNPHTEFSFLGGFVFINEQFQDDPARPPPEHTNSAEILAGFDLRTTVSDGVQITTKMAVLPNLSQSGRYRVEFDSTARIALLKRLTWSLTLFERFDSAPPLAVRRNDYGVVSALGYAF